MISWNNITGLGDAVVLMPTAAAIAGWLLCGRAWRLALFWCLLFSLGLTLVLVTKIAFVGWGIGIPALDFTGLSGHAMRACAVMPVLASLIVHGRSPGLRTAVLTAGYALALMISVSRVMVHAHSMSETIGGCLLGLLVSAIFVRLSRSDHGRSLPRWLLALGLLALLPTSQARPAPTARWIQEIALYLAGHERAYQAEARRARRIHSGGLPHRLSNQAPPGPKT